MRACGCFGRKVTEYPIDAGGIPMMTVTFTADLTILYFVAANIVGILAYVLILKHRMRTQARRQAMLAAQIVEYFRHSGAEVRVNCIPGPDGRRFIAIIDSEPLKRFRYSAYCRDEPVQSRVQDLRHRDRSG